jgi:hypothetical protein
MWSRAPGRAGRWPPGLVRHYGIVDMLYPPFAILAVGALVATGIGCFLGAALHGEWINLDVIGYLIAGGGFGCFAALLLWLDASAARRQPERIWPSRDAMWRSLTGSTLIALFGSIGLGLLVLGGVAAFVRERMAVIPMIGVPLGLLVAVVSGAIANVRARRATPVAPAPDDNI